MNLGCRIVECGPSPPTTQPKNATSTHGAGNEDTWQGIEKSGGTRHNASNVSHATTMTQPTRTRARARASNTISNNNSKLFLRKSKVNCQKGPSFPSTGYTVPPLPYSPGPTPRSMLARRTSPLPSSLYCSPTTLPHTCSSLLPGPTFITLFLFLVRPEK